MHCSIDPFFQTYADDVDALERYGYYDDGITTPDYCPEILPEPYPDSIVNPAVIVFTGAFDPFHEGHHQAVQSAIKSIPDYTVTHVHIVPDNGAYTHEKRPLEYGDNDDRIASIKSYGYQVDTSSIMCEHSPNYTTVLLRTQWAWNQVGCNPTIFMVVGSDNAVFAEVVDDDVFKTIIVPRDCHPIGTRHGIIANHEPNDLSSSKVREESYPYGEKPIMNIKDDLHSVDMDEDVKDELRDMVVSLYSSYGYRIEMHDMRDMLGTVPHVDAVVVSLDKNIPGDEFLDVHRVFIDDVQDGMMTSTDIDVVEGERYFIVDDDSSTGATLNFASGYIEERGGIVVGHHLLFNQPVRNDVVDLSDFTGLPGTGLVIDYQGSRVPYWHPHVNLNKRASVPMKECRNFTRSILSIVGGLSFSN